MIIILIIAAVISAVTEYIEAAEAGTGFFPTDTIIILAVVLIMFTYCLFLSKKYVAPIIKKIDQIKYSGNGGEQLKIREFDVYKSWYCGLCRTLKDRSGALGQLTLTYDMTFLVLILHGLYEPDMQCGECRCIAHPMQKHATRVDRFTEYAADLNLLLMY